MTGSTLKVACIECNTQKMNQPCNFLPDQDINCTHFFDHEAFKSSIGEQDYDAIMFVCESCENPRILTLMNWVRTNCWRNLPLIVLCNENNEKALARTFYAGADDIQTLPVLPRVLGARIRAICSRASRTLV